MASNIVLKTYAAGDNNQGSVTPQNDALIYQAAVPVNGLFSGGTVTLSSANVLHIAAGFGIIGGRFFEILESDISVQLSTSGTLLGRLYIHLSLTNADDPISIETATGASLPALSGDPNLNITNGNFDMELCTFNINELTISDIVMTFPSIVASNNQIRRATAYSAGDMALCQSASDQFIFICTTAGTTAVSEPTAYASVAADGTTVADGSAVFTARSVSGLISALDGKADQTLLAPVETNLSSASQAYAIGEQFLYNGLLYKATAAITQGGTITIDGNCELVDCVTKQINELNSIQTYHNTSFDWYGYAQGRTSDSGTAFEGTVYLDKPIKSGSNVTVTLKSLSYAYCTDGVVQISSISSATIQKNTILLNVTLSSSKTGGRPAIVQSYLSIAIS